MRKPATQKGVLTREKLLASAEEVFGRKGFHAASIVEITREAGVSVGTFYEYFDSKESIFRQLVLHMSHEARRHMAMAAAGQPTRVEKEKAGFRAFFAYALGHKNLYRIVLESQFVDEELYRGYYRRLAEGYRRGLKDALERGEVAGGMAEEIYLETLTYALLGMGQMLGQRWVLWEGKMPPEEALRELDQLLERLLLTQECRPPNE